MSVIPSVSQEKEEATIEYAGKKYLLRYTALPYKSYAQCMKKTGKMQPNGVYDIDVMAYAEELLVRMNITVSTLDDSGNTSESEELTPGGTRTRFMTIPLGFMQQIINAVGAMEINLTEVKQAGEDIGRPSEEQNL